MIIDYSKIDHQYCVYFHKAIDPKTGALHPLFIGVSRYAEYLKAAAARINPDWKSVIYTHKINVEILGVFITEYEARECAKTLIAVLNPRSNLKCTANFVSVDPMIVRCLNDNEEFSNLRECAAYYQIAYSSLAHHLRGDYGYASVKGYKFERINKIGV